MKIIENGQLSERAKHYEDLAAKAVRQAQRENEQLVREGRLAWGSDGRLKVPENNEELLGD